MKSLKIVLDFIVKMRWVLLILVVLALLYLSGAPSGVSVKDMLEWMQNLVR